MLSVIKNNFERLKEHKGYIVLSIVLVLFSVIGAIYVNSVAYNRGKIAFVTNEKHVKLEECKYVDVSKVSKKPDKSDLIFGKYDAIVIDKGNNIYKIESLNDKDFKNMIKGLIYNPEIKLPKDSTERGIGTEILSFLLMIILMQGSSYMLFYSEDKEKGIIERVLVSPISFMSYLAGQLLFSLIFIFCPTFIIISIVKILGFSVGFSLMQYALLLLILTVHAAAFGLVIYSFNKTSDNANLMGMFIVILTSILAGSYSAVVKGNKILEKITNILPQKHYISFINAVEQSTCNYKTLLHLGYIILITVIFFGLAIWKNRRDYVEADN